MKIEKDKQNQEGAISPKRYFILLVFFMEIITMKNVNTLTWSAFFLTLGLIMPFLTGQIPEIGGMLLPMHIPVLICGFICGWKYGLLVGFISPLLRCFLFGMPPFLTAVGMAFELASYGAVTGFFYQKLKHKKARIYISLLIAMVTGRLVWGGASIILYGMSGNTFTWQIFIAGALLNAIPGIILQIILIPVLMLALEKAGVTKNND